MHWRVQVTTVDKYQGQQNDIVLLSLVRTRAVGHVRDVRRYAELTMLVSWLWLLFQAQLQRLMWDLGSICQGDRCNPACWTTGHTSGATKAGLAAAVPGAVVAVLQLLLSGSTADSPFFFGCRL